MIFEFEPLLIFFGKTDNQKKKLQKEIHCDKYISNVNIMLGIIIISFEKNIKVMIANILMRKKIRKDNIIKILKKKELALKLRVAIKNK